MSAVRAIQEKTVHLILKNVLLTCVSKVGQAMKLPMILYASVQWTIPANDAATQDASVAVSLTPVLMQ